MKRFQIIFLRLYPYVLCFVAVFAVMFFGSRPKTEQTSVPLVAGFSDSNFKITADQVTETLTVARIADFAALPSAKKIGENYVTAEDIYRNAGVMISDRQIAEKPTVIDTSDLSRGIITYEIQPGDSLDSIIVAKKLHASKDQIRWSNGMKNETLEAGNVLYLPVSAGIVYVVEAGDTLEYLADHYGSNAEKIVRLNDLEGKKLAPGMRIVLPDGLLPAKERPEYVPVHYCSVSYGKRFNTREVESREYWMQFRALDNAQGNRMADGNCTWFAWHWRRNSSPGPEFYLPAYSLGNARNWSQSLGGSFRIDGNPEYGAVFQTCGGPFGHVGVVTGVVPGVSITIQEMNDNYKMWRVTESTINWDDALQFVYIHERL